MIFLNKYKKSEFLKNILTLFFGTSIAQIIPLMISPILTRMYTPDQFGQLGVLMSVIGLFSIIATFQYESAIMLPKKDKDAFNILTLAVVITIFISILSYVVTSIFNVEISDLLNSPSFSDWVFVIPFFVLLSGLFNSLNIWASRQKKFKRLAIRNVAQTTVGALTKVVLGWLKYLSSGLVWGTLLGQVTSTSVLTYMTVREDKKLFETISLSRIKKNAIEYQDFPKYTMWHGFFDLVNASGVIFIISSFYGLTVVGMYAFILGLLKKPTKMIGQVVSQVFYQNASVKIANNQSIYKDTIRLVKNLALVGGIIFLPMLIFAPFIFSFVFGEKWYEAGVIAQVISPLFFVKFVTAPLVNISVLMKKQKKWMLVALGMNVLFPIILLTSAVLKEGNLTALIISTALVVVYYYFILKWIINLTNR